MSGWIDVDALYHSFPGCIAVHGMAHKLVSTHDEQHHSRGTKEPLRGFRHRDHHTRLILRLTQRYREVTTGILLQISVRNTEPMNGRFVIRFS